MMDRGQVGTLPRTASLEDESYLEFIEAFRTFAVGDLGGVVQAVGQEHVSATVPQDQQGDMPLQQVRDLFNELPAAKTWQRFMRTHQEMMWRRTRASFATDTDGYLKSLADAESEGPGKLVYDPEFEVPKYTRREIHLQPGGYTDDPLGGIVFHYGTKVFYFGANDQDELHKEIAGKTCVPEDGKTDRILDIACSVGQATIPLKERFPDAEVWGLDVGLPLLRYAHKMANDRNVDVNFVQALAEETGFEDNHFDAILSYILFHEVPSAIIPKIVEEVHRILRPGGVFTVYDFPNQGDSPAPGFRFLIDYDSRDNCEPYSPGFVRMDFAKLLEDTGFDIRPGERLYGPYGEFLQAINATKR